MAGLREDYLRKFEKTVKDRINTSIKVGASLGESKTIVPKLVYELYNRYPDLREALELVFGFLASAPVDIVENSPSPGYTDGFRIFLNPKGIAEFIFFNGQKTVITKSGKNVFEYLKPGEYDEFVKMITDFIYLHEATHLSLGHLQDLIDLYYIVSKRLGLSSSFFTDNKENWFAFHRILNIVMDLQVNESVVDDLSDDCGRVCDVAKVFLRKNVVFRRTGGKYIDEVLESIFVNPSSVLPKFSEKFGVSGETIGEAIWNYALSSTDSMICQFERAFRGYLFVEAMAEKGTEAAEGEKGESGKDGKSEEGKGQLKEGKSGSWSDVFIKDPLDVFGNPSVREAKSEEEIEDDLKERQKTVRESIEWAKELSRTSSSSKGSGSEGEKEDFERKMEEFIRRMKNGTKSQGKSSGDFISQIDVSLNSEADKLRKKFVKIWIKMAKKMEEVRIHRGIYSLKQEVEKYSFPSKKKVALGIRDDLTFDIREEDIPVSKVGVILFAFDTSGSIGESELKDFLGVMLSWLKGFLVDKLPIIPVSVQIDTRVKSVDLIDLQFVKTAGKRGEVPFEVVGGGGTDFSTFWSDIDRILSSKRKSDQMWRKAVKFLKDFGFRTVRISRKHLVDSIAEPIGVVFFTDGFFGPDDVPEMSRSKKIPFLWILTSEGGMDPAEEFKSKGLPWFSFKLKNGRW